MNRRDIIKYSMLATGATLSAPLIFSLSSCKADTPSVSDVLHLFSKAEMDTVKALVDTILPKTDSPSASDVGVHTMIDRMVGTVYNEEDRTVYKEKVAKLFAYLMKETGGSGFHQLDENKRLALLEALQDSENEVFKGEREALLDLKQQTIAYYLNTEEIATNYLNYLPVPGTYDPCISLESVGGKAWAI